MDFLFHYIISRNNEIDSDEGLEAETCSPLAQKADL